MKTYRQKNVWANKDIPQKYHALFVTEVIQQTCLASENENAVSKQIVEVLPTCAIKWMSMKNEWLPTIKSFPCRVNAKKMLVVEKPLQRVRFNYDEIIIRIAMLMIFIMIVDDTIGGIVSQCLYFLLLFKSYSI